MHYYQLNIADYRKDTQHLTPIEHYIYRELIDLYYLDEKPISLETQWVMRRLRLGFENEKDLIFVLNEFFKETENGWTQCRIEKEIDHYHSRAEASRINGSKGGRPKKPRITKQVNLANLEKPSAKPTNNHKPITNRERFTPPTVKEISDYVNEKKCNTVDPNTFFSHYETNGWMVGKNKMKSWQSAINGWQARSNQNKTKINDIDRGMR